MSGPPTDDDGQPSDDGPGSTRGDGSTPIDRKYASRRAVLGAAAGGALVGAFGDDAWTLGRNLLSDG